MKVRLNERCGTKIQGKPPRRHWSESNDPITTVHKRVTPKQLCKVVLPLSWQQVPRQRMDPIPRMAKQPATAAMGSASPPGSAVPHSRSHLQDIITSADKQKGVPSRCKELDIDGKTLWYKALWPRASLYIQWFKPQESAQWSNSNQQK